MKRFTDTSKWQKEFYQDLSPLLKCLWSYLCDNCDCSGVWEGNWRLASFQIGEAVTAASLNAFGERVEVLPDGKVWIVGFVAFQNGKLSRDCKPHIPIIRTLEKHGLSNRFPELSDRVSIDYTKGINTLEGKVKVKEEGKDTEGGQEETAAVAEPADPELSADEIAAGIQRIFSTPRKPGHEAMHAISQAMPVQASELANLERFYALPRDEKDHRLSRCIKPTNLALALADELVKARDFFATPAINGHDKSKRCL